MSVIRDEDELDKLLSRRTCSADPISPEIL